MPKWHANQVQTFRVHLWSQHDKLAENRQKPGWRFKIE